MKASGSRSGLLAPIATEFGPDVYLSGKAGRDCLDIGPFEEVSLKVAF
jgi:hypothetical protein